MYVYLLLPLLIIAHAKANDIVLPYNEVAYTTSGLQCIGGCSNETHECAVDWPPKNQPCERYSISVPRRLTKQTRSQHKYCLSNCGYYGWTNAWCYVTSDGKWDYCTHQKQVVPLQYLVLPYTMEAYTTAGKPCIGGCSPDTHQCVASWPPKNEPCVLYNKVAPTFYTTQKRKFAKCLSNCGPYFWSTDWCYVTGDGEWDNCSPQEQQVIETSNSNGLILPYIMVAYTTSGAPCIGGCSPETHQCIASWPRKTELCVLHPTPAPRFRTTQVRTKNEYCLSNCGYYDWARASPRCYVTIDGDWDLCTPQEQVSAKDMVLPYTMIAYTTIGKPCIGGCSPDTQQCVAHWPPRNEPCVIYNTPAPTIYTTKKLTKYEKCLSNCGSYSWRSSWCYVTSDGEWDYCTPPELQVTVRFDDGTDVLLR